jgi:hypothetical protein
MERQAGARTERKKTDRWRERGGEWERQRREMQRQSNA